MNYDSFLYETEKQVNLEVLHLRAMDMENNNMEGLLRLEILRGINLAKRGIRGSDPYVVVRHGDQKLKSRVVKKNMNPEWNEQLTLAIHRDSYIPVKLEVYDRDRFSRDSKIGNAEFGIEELVACRNGVVEVPSNEGTVNKVMPNQDNCLARESSIFWENGNLVQHMFLRLKNVECGEVELRLRWIDVTY